MGAWGSAIFSDDTACDIRSDYREVLEDGLDDDEAMRRVIADYQHLAEDEAHILWLALAAAQTSLGRLDDTVKANALNVIDDGVGLELWVEAGTKQLANRKAALTKLRGALTGPQKSPTKMRKPWSHMTDLVPGDVLAYDRPDGKQALFRVARVDEHRVGAAPVLRQLEWDKPVSPSPRKLRQLKALPEIRAMSEQPSVSFRVARHRRKDPDWSDVGFLLVSRVETEKDDSAFAPRAYADWAALALNLDNRW